MSKAVDPAKRDAKRTRIEQDMLNFRPWAKRACQLTARIDGIDGDFLFGNGRHPPLARECSPFPSCLGTTQVCEGLALAQAN